MEGNFPCRECGKQECKFCNPDDVMKMLNLMRSEMFKQSDAQALEQRIQTNVSQQIKSEVQQLIDPLIARVESLEVGGKPGKGKVWNDPNDPARRRAAFPGFSEPPNAEAQLKAMEDFMINFPHFKPTGYANKYNVNRKDNVVSLKNIGFVEFLNEETMKEFVKEAKSFKVKVRGVDTNVGVAPAKTKFFNVRNCALKKAEEIIKATNPATAVVKEKRTLKLNDVVVFSQGKDDSRGSFCGPCAELQLPA